MKYPFLSFSLLFLMGFLAGNAASHLGFGFLASENREAETALDGRESARPEFTQTAKPCECNERAVVTAARPARAPKQTAGNLHDSGFYPNLPPHVGDPYFFGLDIDDPEVLWQREEAVKDFIASLKGSGFSDDEIAVLTEAAEAELAAISNPEPDTGIYEGDMRLPPSLDEQAEGFARSLREAGQPEEVVEQMLDSFWAAETMEPMESIEDIMPLDPYNPEGSMQ